MSRGAAHALAARAGGRWGGVAAPGQEMAERGGAGRRWEGETKLVGAVLGLCGALLAQPCLRRVVGRRRGRVRCLARRGELGWLEPAVVAGAPENVGRLAMTGAGEIRP